MDGTVTVSTTESYGARVVADAVLLGSETLPAASKAVTENVYAVPALKPLTV
ncbi:hypothetical protein D3C74_451390 [compost metagenome]